MKGLMAVSNNILSDTDGDGLTLEEEYQHGTDPLENDSDGDGQWDGFEVNQGSNPTDNTDEGTAPSTNYLVALTLKVGDHSSSASEIYEMVMTGPASTNRLHSGGYGKVTNKTFRVKTGASYNIAINHVGSSRTDPEYDYTAQVTYTSTAPVIIDDPESILGVKGTAGTFDDTFGALNKIATVNVVKATFEAQPDMINFGFDPTGAEPWASVISGSENPVAQVVLSPFYEGMVADLVVSNESFLSIDTSSCAAKTNTFTLTGLAKGEAGVEVKKDGLNFGKLNVHVFEKQNLSVGIYRIYNSRSHSSNSVAGASASLIQSTMNTVFKQCGIEFSVSDYGSTNIWYDDNTNGICERWFDTNGNRVDEMDFLPDLNCSEDINFIYLNESGYPYDEENPGFMVRGTGLNSEFVGYHGAVLFLNGPDGLGDDDFCAMAAAHEAGHVLGIAHASSDSEGHDTGPVPEGSSALMKSGAPVGGVLPTSIDGWIRQEDWLKANETAKGM